MQTTPTEIIRRLQQKQNDSEHTQRAVTVAILAAMQIKLNEGADYRTTAFIETVMDVMDAMVRDYEPLAKVARRSTMNQREQKIKEITNKALNDLTRITGDDFHGYRSEIWMIVANAIRDGVDVYKETL